MAGEQSRNMSQRGLSGHNLRRAVFIGAQQRLPDPARAVHEFVTEAPAVAQKVAVYVVVITVEDSPQLAIPLAGNGVATHAAMRAYRRRRLQIPFAGVMLLQGLVGEDSSGTDFDQVAAEFVLQDAVFVAPEVNVVAHGEDIEIAPAGVVAIESDAAIALDAAVHLVIDER